MADGQDDVKKQCLRFNLDPSHRVQMDEEQIKYERK